uniref:Uncharacterized protein n=1 Tax=Zooxanthella nutricula TaxID=1333877 RepID=A0A7S2L715_9DINO
MGRRAVALAALASLPPALASAPWGDLAQKVSEVHWPADAKTLLDVQLPVGAREKLDGVMGSLGRDAGKVAGLPLPDAIGVRVVSGKLSDAYDQGKQVIGTVVEDKIQGAIRGTAQEPTRAVNAFAQASHALPDQIKIIQAKDIVKEAIANVPQGIPEEAVRFEGKMTLGQIEVPTSSTLESMAGVSAAELEAIARESSTGHFGGRDATKALGQVRELVGTPPSEQVRQANTVDRPAMAQPILEAFSQVDIPKVVVEDRLFQKAQEGVARLQRQVGFAVTDNPKVAVDEGVHRLPPAVRDGTTNFQKQVDVSSKLALLSGALANSVQAVSSGQHANGAGAEPQVTPPAVASDTVRRPGTWAFAMLGAVLLAAVAPLAARAAAQAKGRFGERCSGRRLAAPPVQLDIELCTAI